MYVEHSRTWTYWLSSVVVGDNVNTGTFIQAPASAAPPACRVAQAQACCRMFLLADLRFSSAFSLRGSPRPPLPSSHGLCFNPSPNRAAQSSRKRCPGGTKRGLIFAVTPLGEAAGGVKGTLW